MEWTEITVKTARQYAEDVSAVVSMVSSGIYIEDYSELEKDVAQIAHTDLIERSLLEKDRENVIIHAYFGAGDIGEITGFIGERLNESSIPHEITTFKIDDTDWAENWKQYYKPFNVGERLVIRPEWEDCEPGGRTVLTIEPGLAFGTGTHETTRMCLELLEENVYEGCETLDIGCGSGILSVAALLLGADRAVAVDIDPIAVKTAKQNGALNDFHEEQIVVYEGNLTDCLNENEKFDIILANITAEPIIGLLPRLAAHMKKNSVFICSGIIDTKLCDVTEGMERNGFAAKKTRALNGWAAITAVRAQKGDENAKVF